MLEKTQIKKKEAERLRTMPPWQQELLLRRKEQEKLDKMPKWQKDLVLKKNVASTKIAFENFQNKDSTSAPWSQNSLKKTQRRL